MRIEVSEKRKKYDWGFCEGLSGSSRRPGSRSRRLGGTWV